MVGGGGSLSAQLRLRHQPPPAQTDCLGYLVHRIGRLRQRVVFVLAFAERTGIVVGFPMTQSEQHEDNSFAIAAQGTKGEVGYVLVHQPKSFDWRARKARPHAWGGGHSRLLAAALKRFDAVFGVSKR